MHSRRQCWHLIKARTSIIVQLRNGMPAQKSLWIQLQSCCRRGCCRPMNNVIGLLRCSTRMCTTNFNRFVVYFWFIGLLLLLLVLFSRLVPWGCRWPRPRRWPGWWWRRWRPKNTQLFGQKILKSLGQKKRVKIIHFFKVYSPRRRTTTAVARSWLL